MKPPTGPAGPAGPAQLLPLGPFFAVDTHAPGAAPGPPWRPMAELLTDPGVLDARVAAVRRTLAAGSGRAAETLPVRVAASVVHLGLVSRVLSPYAALTVLTGAAPETPDLAALYWQPLLGGPYPLSLPLRSGGPAPEPRPAAADPVREAGEHLAAGLLGAAAPVRQLTAGFVRLGVPPRVLWGNVASAVHGAAAMIGRGRPDRAATARGIATVLLTARAAPELHDAGAYTAQGAFRRRSCCLIYQAAADPAGAARRAGALCGDCVLRGPRARRTGA